MNTSQHPSVVPPATDSDAPRARSGFPRDLLLTVVIVALLLAVALGGSVAPHPGAPVAEAQASAPQPTQEFVYFPSQYVNQGTEMPEPTSAF